MIEELIEGKMNDILVIIVSLFITYIIRFIDVKRVIKWCILSFLNHRIKFRKLKFIERCMLYCGLRRKKFANKILSEVSLILSDFHDVLDCPIENRIMKIHFVDPSVSYELRQPITDEKVIDDIVKNKIHPFYRKLDDKLRKQGMRTSCLFTVDWEGKKDVPVCEVLQSIYSTRNILNAIKDVQNTIGKDGSIKFIGDKVGICGFEVIRKKGLQLFVYETDHFTFKVFKNIYKNPAFNDIFRLIISRVNMASLQEKKLLVECLTFLFSSVGIDVIIGGKDKSKESKVLLATRNGDIESNHTSTIHVPVNESFSKTDMEEGESKYSLKRCLTRGIKEELGIPIEISEKAKTIFYDFAIVSDEGEIGMGCYVDFTDKMPIEQTRMYPGQDKFLEITNILIVPFPPFQLNPDRYRNWFYKQSKDDRFSMRWTSFTPLLYQRFSLRSTSHSELREFITEAILLTISIYWLSRRFDVSNALEDQLWSLAVAFCFISIIEIFRYIYKRSTQGICKPLVPQWDGDAKVLQCTTHFQQFSSEKDEINTIQLTLGILPERHTANIQQDKENKEENKEGLNETIALKDLRLISPPYCSIRREAQGHSEYPISFYHVAKENIGLGSRLNFINLPFMDSAGELVLYLFVTTNGKKVLNYSFTQDIDTDLTFQFKDKLGDKEIASYSKYYKIEEQILRQMTVAKLGVEFMSAYNLLDLFYFNHNYYWTYLSEKNEVKPDIELMVQKHTKSKDLFINQIQPNLSEKKFVIALRGSTENIDRLICEFIAREDNRRHMTDLDIYALQLFLIRSTPSIVLAEKSNGFLKDFFYKHFRR